MSEGALVDKSESSSFEDLASAAAHEIEEAKIAEAAASAMKENANEVKTDEWQDVLGSGALLKKILKVGDESKGLRPQRGDICRISYEIKIKDNDTVVERKDQTKIYLGDNEVLQGIDLALTLMYRGEECLLQIAPRFGFGDAGLKPGDSLGLVGEMNSPKYDGPLIGPDVWLEARLELQDWTEEPDHETLSIAERMEIGVRRRARGNWWYSRGEAQLAVQLYRRALDALDESEGGITEPTPSGDLAPTSDALQKLLEERLRVHNNMAAAQLKAGAYEAALQAVTRVLSCQPQNAKALYRKSRILTAMGRNSEALEAARAAAAAAPDDPGTRKELQRCEQKANRDRSVERKLAKRMLGTSDQPSNSPPSPEKKSSRAKMLKWGSLLLGLLVGVASVLVYRYKLHSH